MRKHIVRNPARTLATLSAIAGLGILVGGEAHAIKLPSPPPPCHPNPNAAPDREAVLNRGDVRHLPDPLRDVLGQLAGRPHSVLPVQAYAEADHPSVAQLLDRRALTPVSRARLDDAVAHVQRP